MRRLKVLLLLILLPVYVKAGDFGLSINQNTEAVTSGDTFEYTAAALPYYYCYIGDTGSLFASAGFTLEYANGEVYFIPELLRTEFSMHFDKVGVRAGRFGYSTPLPVIADGLFDGFQLTHTSGAGKFGLGAWYTGLICKNTLDITMTDKDMIAHNTPIDLANFADTYFASRRMFISADWEHPSVLELFSAQAAFTSQFDLNDHEAKYNSQYLMLKAGIPVNRFYFEVGGVIELIQHDPAIDGAANTALAGELGIIYTLPTSFNSRLTFNAVYASGKTEGSMDAFVPITTKKYGEIFQSKITGLTVLSLDYSARVAETLGVSLKASYFIRNDLAAYDTFPVQDTDGNGHLLGGEFYGRLVWSPVSDLQLILGGGAFVPAMGDNWTDSSPVWKANLAIILSVL